MVRVTLPAGIESLSGRFGDVCFRTMKATGRTYMVRLPSRRRTRITASELEARERFKRRAQLVSQMRKAGSKLSTNELWEMAKRVL